MGFLENLGKKFGLPDVLKNMPRFGTLLHQYRTLQGVTIEDLAAAVEIAPSALREMEEGRRPAPSEKKVRAICKTLKLDPDETEALTDSADLDSPALAALTGRAPAEAAPPMTAAIFVFLIADIRGYTQFTARYGDKAAATLALRFAEQGHAVTERWGGRLVEVRGDEVLGAFASAQQALHAAHDLHERYTALTRDNPEWPDGIGVGVDVGEAEQVESGYRGAALNRAARLCSLAAPGETLVTTGVAYVAPHVEHVIFTLRGQERLKGFDSDVPILLASPGDAPGVQAAVEADPASPEQPRSLPPATE
jgi:class 3 adenylate cyclase